MPLVCLFCLAPLFSLVWLSCLFGLLVWFVGGYLSAGLHVRLLVCSFVGVLFRVVVWLCGWLIVFVLCFSIGWLVGRSVSCCSCRCYCSCVCSFALIDAYEHVRLNITTAVRLIGSLLGILYGTPWASQSSPLPTLPKLFQGTPRVSQEPTQGSLRNHFPSQTAPVHKVKLLGIHARIYRICRKWGQPGRLRTYLPQAPGSG